MAERQTAISPATREGRLTRRPFAWWGGDPFAALQRLADDMDRMFDEFGFGLGPRWGSGLWGEPGTAPLTTWMPDVEVVQKGDQLTIRADLPGMTKDEVSVDVTDKAVTIAGERKREREEEHEGYYRSERSYGSFRRVIPLPEGAITEQAKASFRNGVLEIALPAPPAGKGRRLEITEGARQK
jgi:HSP20 family protein